MASIDDGQILVRNVYLGVDPGLLPAITDAIILDIEDGVAGTLKTAARASSATAPSPESDRHG